MSRACDDRRRSASADSLNLKHHGSEVHQLTLVERLNDRGIYTGMHGSQKLFMLSERRVCRCAGGGIGPVHSQCESM